MNIITNMETNYNSADIIEVEATTLSVNGASSSGVLKVKVGRRQEGPVLPKDWSIVAKPANQQLHARWVCHASGGVSKGRAGDSTPPPKGRRLKVNPSAKEIEQEVQRRKIEQLHALHRKIATAQGEAKAEKAQASKMSQNSDGAFWRSPQEVPVSLSQAEGQLDSPPEGTVDERQLTGPPPVPEAMPVTDREAQGPETMPVTDREAQHEEGPPISQEEPARPPVIPEVLTAQELLSTFNQQAPIGEVTKEPPGPLEDLDFQSLRSPAGVSLQSRSPVEEVPEGLTPESYQVLPGTNHYPPYTSETLSYNSSEIMSATNFACNMHADLTNIRYLATDLRRSGPGYPSKIVEIETGYQFKFDPQLKKYVELWKYPRPLDLFPHEAKIYYAVCAAVQWGLDRPKGFNPDIERFIEASILTNRHYFGDGLPKPMFKYAATYFKGALELVELMWYNHPQVQSFVIRIGFDQNIKIYSYTNQVPTYREVSLNAFNKLVYKFLKFVFPSYAPSDCQRPQFTQAFVSLLIRNYGLDLYEFGEKHMKTGVPFSDVFLYVPQNAAQVEKLPYTKDVFTVEEPIKSKYIEPKFEKNMIVLSDMCMLVLENLCAGDGYLYVVLRGLIRNVLLAHYEGTAVQTGFWLYGPPACMKSVWVKLLKKLISREFLEEYSHAPNQFTAGLLEGKKLVVLSDVTDLGQDQYKHLKPILGRDLVQSLLKYKNGSRTFIPSHITVFVSNSSPYEVHGVKNDPAFLQKLVLAPFPSEAAIDQKRQIPNVERFFDFVLHEIINWALYAPQSTLENFIRATRLNLYLQHRQGNDNIGGLPGFLKDHYMFSSSPEAFTTISDLIIHLKQYQERSSDDVVLTDLNSTRSGQHQRLQKEIVNCVSTNFGRTIVYCRYTRRDKDGIRAMGFKGLIRKPDTKKGEQESEALEAVPFELRSEQLKIKLDHPFYTEQRIGWLMSDNLDYEGFEQTQKGIRNDRISRGLKTNFDLHANVPLSATQGSEEAGERSATAEAAAETNPPEHFNTFDQHDNGSPPL